MATQQVTLKQRYDSLQGLLEQYRGEIAAALPAHMTPERVIRVALSACSGQPLLLQCQPLSVVASVVQASILGLEPNSLLGFAYLIPFWNKKANNNSGAYQCQLMPGYQGLVKLARNTGEFSTIDAQPVYVNDEFDFQKGSDTWWRHKWSRSGERGEIEGYWAGYVLKDGAKNFEYMTVSQIEQHRDQYSKGAYNKEGNLQGPWKDSPDWMFRKTPLKQVLKLAPKSIELQAAMSISDRVEAGLTQRYTADVPIDILPEASNEDEGDAREPEVIEQPTRKSNGGR